MIDSLGRIVVAANITDGGQQKGVPIRYLPDGTLDAAFLATAITQIDGTAALNPSIAYGVALFPDDSLGFLSEWGGDAYAYRIDDTGAMIPAFNGGFRTVAGAQPVRGGVFASGTDLVIAYNDPTGALQKYDAAGSLGDSVAWTYPLVGITDVPFPDFYAAMLVDGTDLYTGTAVLGGAPTEALIGDTVNDLKTNANGWLGGANNGIGYTSGQNPLTADARVARITPGLVLDATFGVGGYVDLIPPGSAGSQATSVIALGPDPDDVIVSGFASIGGVSKAWTARLDDSGALVPAYGTAGFEVYDLPGSTAAVLQDSGWDEAAARLFHTGQANDGANLNLFVAKTLESDGSLDPTFG